jgi:NADH-quinone oxidoreductase subunit N
MALASFSPSSALAAISTYAVATTGAFIAAEAVLTLDPEWDGTVAGLAGLARRSPALALGMSLTMLSMAGIPPLLGFWGKLQVFQVTIARAVGLASQGSAQLALWFALLTVVGVGGAVVSIAYYGAVVRAVYSQGDIAVSTEQPTRNPALIATLAVGAATLALGLVPVFASADVIIRGFRM